MTSTQANTSTLSFGARRPATPRRRWWRTLVAWVWHAARAVAGRVTRPLRGRRGSAREDAKTSAAMAAAVIDEALAKDAVSVQDAGRYRLGMTAFTADPPEAPPADDDAGVRVHRIEVWPTAGEPDPHARQYADDLARAFGRGATLRVARVYLIEAALDAGAVERIARELLADPVNQRAVVGASEAQAADGSNRSAGVTIETHFLPGVMDPVAQSARDAIIEMLGPRNGDASAIEVRTGYRYDIAGVEVSPDQARAFAEAHLANTVVQEIHVEPFVPEAFPHTTGYAFRLTHVSIRELDDAGLTKMSREAHLFLSLDEMRAVQSYYRDAQRDPTDIELETIAQTWSEHCVHKTLKATVKYRGQGTGDRSQGSGDRGQGTGIDFRGRPGHEVHEDGSVTIHNLLKSTIAAATHELTKGESASHHDFCVSVFVDNAGIIRFDDEDAVCIKVETHNHPSALEPYGGAATGIGGCIRDVMGTGLAARPIANTDVFCVAPPSFGSASPMSDVECGMADVKAIPDADANDATLLTSDIRHPTSHIPKGVIAPKRILQQVVAGVRDYGNRMGIPTVNGAVWFHDDYLANPLVYCGCVGIMPLDKCFGKAQPGDRIIVLGGATGRDGIHGATFSSAELTDTHADEFAHAVQIGNAITQKKTLDVILQARGEAGDTPLYHAITDCGAGGFSSAVGEMGEKVGARVTLDTAPLKYDGLSYTEIWISEAQERMVLAVPPENVAELRALCDAEDVPLCDLGEFGHTNDAGEAQLILTYHGSEVGRLSMQLLHDGIPMPVREAVWESQGATPPTTSATAADARRIDVALKSLLAHPNIASKHWIIRQYDHEVQGGSVIKPLVGPGQDGPGDAAVVRPKLTSDKAIALGCGLAPNLSESSNARGWATDGDSYWMALAAIDEAVRNVICAGADPDEIAILDNFCWPKCDNPRNLATLVHAAEACYDGALAYRTPFVSGKDSLNNQFTTEDGRIIAIPQTLLITAMGIVPDAKQSRTMDAKAAGNLLFVIGATDGRMGGSHYVMTTGDSGVDRAIPRVDLTLGPKHARVVADLIARGLVASAHDCSDGGLLVAAAEMAFAGRVGLDIDLEGQPTNQLLEPRAACFSETPSRYLIEVAPRQVDALLRVLKSAGVSWGQVGTFADHDRLTVRNARDGRIMDASLDELRDAWKGTLDF